MLFTHVHLSEATKKSKIKRRSIENRIKYYYFNFAFEI